MNDKLTRFTALLRQIFELDKSDLDFGIYRVLNIRKVEIERFLTRRLPELVRKTLEPFAQSDSAEVRAELARIEQDAGDVTCLPESSPMRKRYHALQKQLAEGNDLTALETDVYSALYSFFSRYYEEGDFISKRRYKEGVYAIPYEGEEVKLYWANRDQYYIKTSENFKDYTFTAGDFTIHFRLVDATTEQNNNKETAAGKRVFMLFSEDEEHFPGLKPFEYNRETRELVIRFFFDIPEDKKKKYEEENYTAICSYIVQDCKELIPVLLTDLSKDKKKPQTLLQKHLRSYVAKNTFDYYIHKDLHGFLTRELDFYIKSEIMHLDDLDTGNEAHAQIYLAKIRAVKQVGRIVIDFLTQIEEFQKKLWLKKKFVVETNWCMTLDRVDESFWPEVLDNRAQLDEWIDLYAIDQAEGWTDPPTLEFLRQNQNLLLDTKHFSEQFKQRLTASIDELDRKTDGVLVNSDNFHALSLLQRTFAQKVQCVYIDPPFNAKSSEILYKNTFKHSAWLSLLNDRIRLSQGFLDEQAVYVCAIDEVEQERLGLLLDDIFSGEGLSRTCVTVVHNPSGQQGDNFSATHEYAYFVYRTPGRSIAEQYREDPQEWDRRGLRDVTGKDSLRSAGKTCFYPIYIRDGAITGFGEVCPDDFHPPVNVQREDGVIEVYPIDPQGVERKWRFSRDTIAEVRDQLIPNYLSARDVWDIQRLKKHFNYKTVWQAPKYSANNYGTQVLNRMFKTPPFTYPKSIYTVQDCIEAALNGKKTGVVLDFFAGSGTTGYLARHCQLRAAAVSTDQLRLYDENILRHTVRISEKRGAVRWKYFQYLALLFTEMYLDRYFSDREAFCAQLNDWLQGVSSQSLGQISFSPYTPDRMNKLALMCATGSGKTLLMHMNILQFLHYFQRARRRSSRLSLNKIIVLAPNEGMSRQHLEELALSSIPAALFDKDWRSTDQREDVVVIDINKLKEEGRVKTVSVDSFEHNNLVLVDEGHRGLSGNIWYDFRTRLSMDGFSFEYSATFKQALNASSRKSEENSLMDEYGKSILMDYSYKYFYEDGYGKDYHIYNLRSSTDEDRRRTYLTGCLLSFYQQLKLFDARGDQMREFQIEKPLLVFVGNRVTASPSPAELTDVEEVLVFLDQFLLCRPDSVKRIRAILYDDTGLVDDRDNELFYQDFDPLREFFGREPEPEAVFADMLRLVFNADPGAGEPRLRVENLRQVPGEIALRVGTYGEYFGVISIGDTAGLMKLCEQNKIASKPEEFISQSLFQDINRANSNLKVLIGARKFTEGWNSWRVSTMGLIHFARGEGAQAIQLFGRGVRLKGWQGCLKRSRKLDNPPAVIPRNIEVLETLTIFGVRAQYMEDFKRYLALEGAPANDQPKKYRLSAVPRTEAVRAGTLYTLKVPRGTSFKKQAPRLVLDTPDPDLRGYLLRNRTVLDCRSRVQTIDSVLPMRMESLPTEQRLPDPALPLLDYGRIFEELERHKQEKGYSNVIILRERLEDILRFDGWYGLLIPKNQLEIDSIAKLDVMTDYAVMALNSYLDKFYRFEKARWEAPLLEYAPLELSDANFFNEYRITYAPRGSHDRTGDRLEAFFAAAKEALAAQGGLGGASMEELRGRLTLIDSPSHLYTPLVCLKQCDLNLDISPVSLNESEGRFVQYLDRYVREHAGFLAGKDLYLLRNKSKSGVGFFEAEHFFPDFILWVDTADTQYITFIDPKGLMQIGPEHPKIMFYRTIKELEARLASPIPGKKFVLNSFILSSTPSSQLYQRWLADGVKADRAWREARNVYTLDNDMCVESMMEKIFS